MTSTGTAASRRRRRTGPQSLCAVVVLSLMIATPALAHISLERSNPANGDALSAPVNEVRIRFTGGVEPRYTSLRLFDSTGREIVTSAVRVLPDSENKAFVGALAEPLATPGQYRVEWKTAGADGHIMTGTFSFTINAATAPTPRADTQQLPPEHHTPSSTESSPSASIVSVAVRWLNFSALIALLGVVVFQLWVAPRAATAEGGERLVRHAGERAIRVVTVAALASAVALIARLWLQSISLHGAEYAWDIERVSTMLRITRWGNAWALQLVAVSMLAVGLLLARRTSGAPRGWRVIAIATLVMAVVPALSGHAAATPGWSAIAVVADVAHVIAAGAWIGTLAALILCGVPASRSLDKGTRIPAFASLVRNFSNVAVGAVAVVIATGVLSAIFHLNSPDDLFRTEYGLTLVTKLGTLLLVLATGFYNWRFVQPVLTSEGAVRRLRTSASLEIAVGLAVLLITAVLVALPLS